MAASSCPHFLAASAVSPRTPCFAPFSTGLRLRHRPEAGSARFPAGSVATKKGASMRRGDMVIVGARRPGKERSGVVEAVEPKETSDQTEPDDMYMGRKLEGLEPNFWEGEKWDAFGFVIQYLWAFGFLVSLVTCGVLFVTYYYSSANDIKESEVFKKAMENEETSSSFEADNSQDSPEMMDAPSLL